MLSTARIPPKMTHMGINQCDGRSASACSRSPLPELPLTVTAPRGVVTVLVGNEPLHCSQGNLLQRCSQQDGEQLVTHESTEHSFKSTEGSQILMNTVISYYALLKITSHQLQCHYFVYFGYRKMTHWTPETG